MRRRRLRPFRAAGPDGRRQRAAVRTLEEAYVSAWVRNDRKAVLATLRWFAGWLEREGYRPDRIYTVNGTGLVTREHLQKLDTSRP